MNNDSVEYVNMCKSFVNLVIHLFPMWNKFFSLHHVDLVAFNFDFDLVPPFYFPKWNYYFSASENLPNFSCHFWKHKSVLLHILHQSSVLSNLTPLYFFNSNINFDQKEHIKVEIFEIFKCSGQNSSNS